MLIARTIVVGIVGCILALVFTPTHGMLEAREQLLFQARLLRDPEVPQERNEPSPRAARPWPQCTICLDRCAQQSLFFTCAHHNAFCHNCTQDWLSRRNPTCPLCRHDPFAQFSQIRENILRGTLSFVECNALKWAINSPIDQRGNTPLLLAIASGHATLAQLIIDAGADPDVSNFSGETPLSMAWHKSDWLLVMCLAYAKLFYQKG